jgi:hypothetical protein
LYRQKFNFNEYSTKFHTNSHFAADQNSSQFAVLIFLLVLVTGFKGYGQTVYPGYLDGQVYVRINGVGNQIPLYNIGDSLNVYPASIQSIISNYQVIKIKKAFKLRSDTTVDHIYKVVFSDTSNVVALINDFEAIPFTDFAEKVPLYKTFCTNEGANFWTNGNPSNYHLNLTNACNAFPLLSPGNAQIRVAVVDNEFNINHPDLVNKFNPALCWDVSDNDANVQGPLSYNHGTHCAGIIAAENNNNLGVASIGGGWQTINPIELMGIKATPDNLGVGNQIIDGYDAINEAANLGARIISCSWGDQTNSPTATMSIADQIALNQTLNNFTDIILVCAAGNSNTLNNAFPAAATQATAPLISVPNLDRIISVGSIDALSAKSFFSNFGPTVDICAPGTNIFSPIHNGTYQFSSGTSMAAPMVASLLALVAYNNPNFTTQQIINCVISTATNIDNPNSNFIGLLGAGLINCEAALNCTPSTNISFIINDITFCRNIPQNINVTVGNLPVGVTVSSIQWNLPGSSIGTAIGQNITGLFYPQFGVFPVSITCTLSNLTVLTYNTSFISLGDIELVSTSEMPVCNNSMQQISVVDASSLFVYSSFTCNPIFNPIPPQLSTNFNGTNQSYFQLTNNQTVSLNNVNYNFQNNVFNQTCPLNEVVTYNPMCCEVNTIENGDISAGNTLFTSGVVFSPLCNRPGIYRIDQPTQALQNEPIGFSNGNRIYYDGPYNFTNFINIPPPNCGPATIINFIPLAPIDNRMHTQLGLSSIIWQQSRPFTTNHDYKFSFLSRHNNDGLYLPFRVRVRITNGVNNIFTSTILLHFQQDHSWNLNEISIQNFPAVTGNYNIIIEQLNNYGDWGFDLSLDDIRLQVIYPYFITSPLGTACLQTGNTTTLTTTIPSSGVANYVWSGPGNGIVGPNNTQTITVQLPGVYTVTSTNASPVASNCPILQNTYTVNGTAIDATVSYNVCVGTITTNIVSSTGSSFTYSLNGGPQQATNIFTGLAAGIYTVVVTDNNGCTGSTIVNVNPAQFAITASASPSSICLGDNSNLIAIGAPTYSWLPAASLSNSTISNPIANPVTTTTYTVTGSSGINCSATAIVTVNVLPPNATQCICPQMPVQTFVNPLASTILAFYPLSVNNTIINATFGIDGVLTMDVDLTFQVCNIFMAPDAEIQVVGNHTIKFEDNCVVQTPAQCPMWKGISANGIGNNIVVQGSTLKDMKTGLQVEAGAELDVNGSSFFDNYISIHLKNQNNTYGSITSNTFKTDANFLKDPYLSQKGEHGIILQNCSNITIGDPINATNKNHFENLYNGIYIRDAVALSSINTITTSLNTFKNIVGGPSLMGVASPPWGTPYNMQHRGTAIFGNSSIQTNNLWLKHYGNNNSTVDFDACTKAILVNAFNTEIHNNRVASTISAINPEAGFLTYKNEGKVIYIRYNHILNTILGVNLNGTASFCDVHGNSIETNTTYDLSGFPASFFTTTGINVSEFSTIPNQQGKYIDYNTLTINNLAAGEGINVLKTRWGRLHDNVIHFASNDPSADNTSRPSLVGIRLNKVDLSRVKNNNVVLDNHANTAILQNRKTIGIELYESPSNIFDCNTNDYLHWGMQVRGECAIIQPDHFKQNFFRTYYFGIYSTNLSSQGYLGRDIGFYDFNQGGYRFDANNQFANAVNASNKRLFRFLPTPTTNCDNAKRVKYYTTASTNTLINGMPNHSESAGGTGICTDYIVNQSFSPAEIATSCVPIQNNIMGEEDGGEPFTDYPDVDGMIDIAQDSVLYSEYPELGEWYDERRLMDMLTTHDSLRLQYPILNTFYMQRQQGNLDKLNKIDRYLGMLSDSATVANSASYAFNLQQAIQLNNELNSAEYYVQNEKWINILYMRRWDIGNDTISETEAEAIDALASECPYVAGNAVYKARMLNAYYFPTKQYNDKVICNAVGVFKNGKGLFDDEEAYLDSIMNTKSKGLVASELIKVYPNPTHDKVTIEFEVELLADAQFELMDLSGRVILTKTLTKGISSTTLKLPQIADGLYTYKIALPNGKAYNGKLIKN